MASAERGVVWLNELPQREAEEAFLKVCHTHVWAARMAARRPFATEAEVNEAASEEWAALDRSEWLVSIQAHPPLGSRPPREKSQWESEESKGLASAEADVMRALDEVNAAYFARFGYVALVCATGKAAAELLAIIQGRMGNDAETELTVAATESDKITKLRLRKMFAEVESRL